MEDIFISYSHKDKSAVDSIADALKAEGFSVLYDRDFSAGQIWTDKALEFILSTRCAIFFISRNSIVSRPLLLELQAAEKDSKRCGYYFFAVLLDNLTAGELYRDLRWSSDFTPSQLTVASKICELLPDDRLYILNDCHVVEKIIDSLKKNNIGHDTSSAPVAETAATDRHAETTLSESFAGTTVSDRSPETPVSDPPAETTASDPSAEPAAPDSSVGTTVPFGTAAKPNEEKKIKGRLRPFRYKRTSGGGFEVTGLEDVFLRKAVIPKGVESIAERAFEGTALYTVSLPDGLLEIGAGAFRNCVILQSVNIPESVEAIGDEAFAGCADLEIEIPRTVKILGKDVTRGTRTENKEREQTSGSGETGAEEAAAELSAESDGTETEKTAVEQDVGPDDTETEEAVGELIADPDGTDTEEDVEEPIAEPDGTETKEAAGERVAGFDKGRFVEFGSYPQTSDGKKWPIEWLVLETDGKKALLISRYALDCQSYNNTGKHRKWESCSLRKWLNNIFLSNAFSAEEEKTIESTMILNVRNPNKKGSPGDDPQNKVFLLSVEEANYYFESDDERKCTPTDYAIAGGAYTDGEHAACWWLRSLGSPLLYDNSARAAFVNSDGSVNFTGDFVDRSVVCVRPALWINLESQPDVLLPGHAGDC